MLNTNIVGKVAGIFSLAAFVPYIFAMLRGEIKPNRATWWIWTVVGCLLAANNYSSGASDSIWVPVSYVIGPLATAILSTKYGEGGWTRFDRNCLLSSGVSVVLWWMFSSPLVALFINLFIAFLGVLPTIRKAYYEPESESRIAWALFFSGDTFNLFAIRDWVFAIAAYPTWLALCSSLIAILVFLRPRKHQQRN